MGTNLTEGVEFLKTYMAQSEQMKAAVNEHNAKLFKGKGGTKDWKYQSAEGFYLAEGQAYSGALTDDEINFLLEVFKEVSKAWKTKECYGNAALLSWASEGKRHSLIYCEGMAMNRLFPVQHAWVSLNGKPVDVTWRIDEDDKPTRMPKKILRRVLANLDGHYWGVAVPTEVLTKHIAANEVYCPIVEGVGYSYDLLRTGTEVAWRACGGNRSRVT